MTTDILTFQTVVHALDALDCCDAAMLQLEDVQLIFSNASVITKEDSDDAED